MYSFTFFVIDAEARIEIGKSSAVNVTSRIEIPSTRMFHEIPHGSYQSTRSVNWKPAS